MKILKKMFDNTRGHFEKEGRLAALKPLFDATETFFLFPGIPTSRDAHIRDSLDVKRFMSFVILALLAPFFYGIYNTGAQALLSVGRTAPFWETFRIGAATVIPIVIVSYGAGFFWEILFAAIRKHPISEGFLVTGLLFPMILPPTIPLWQVAVGISFGVVIGKEVFGGTGRNILNPALTARAFVFFAYPAQMSGDRVWRAVVDSGTAGVDAFSGATPLAAMLTETAGEKGVDSLAGFGYSLSDMFLGNIPGSIGETSALLCFLGAVFLMVTGIASYRTIIGGVVGLLTTAGLLNLLAGPDAAAGMLINPLRHLAAGGFAFGIVYMATDPVSSPGMNQAKWVYGLAIGSLTVLIRVFNPAYPEGVMLSILFMNLFAPLLDQFVLKTVIKKRIPNV